MGHDCVRWRRDAARLVRDGAILLLMVGRRYAENRVDWGWRNFCSGLLFPL